MTALPLVAECSMCAMPDEAGGGVTGVTLAVTGAGVFRPCGGGLLAATPGARPATVAVLAAVLVRGRAVVVATAMPGVATGAGVAGFGVDDAFVVVVAGVMTRAPG